MSLADIMRADRRLVILRILAEAPQYELNDSVVATGLASMGHSVSRDLVATELDWLDEQGLVTIERVEAARKTILVIQLTPRGHDVQAGRTIVTGVAKPSPI
jgi:DNA-binding PadR family transcriptional regulator